MPPLLRGFFIGRLRPRRAGHGESDPVNASPALVLTLALAVVCAASVGGGVAAIRVRMGHRALQFALSAVAGVMLGVACFHMLPHALMARGPQALATHGGLEPVMGAAVLGFVLMFVLARFLDHHRHESPDELAHDGSEPHGHHVHEGHSHGTGCSHGDAPAIGRSGWIGACAGLSLHSLLEGIAIAAAIELGAREGHGAVAGLATVLVVVLHKPFDAMTLSTMLAASGASPARRHAVNLAFAAIVPLGALAFLLGVRDGGPGLLSLALAFSAGTFLCIAAADLLPELQFHSHDRVGLTAALVAGLALAWGVGRLEAVAHDHAAHAAGSAGHAEGASDHGHAGHDHSGHDHAGHDHSGHGHGDAKGESGANDPGH